METKNTIIRNYANSLNEAACSVNASACTLGDSEAENIALIKTLNVLVESVRSQTVILQQALDNYIPG